MTQDNNAQESLPPVSVLVIADPDLPSSRTNSSFSEITRRLQKILGRPVLLELRTELIKLDPQGTVSFFLFP